MEIKEYENVLNRMYTEYPSGLSFKDMENPENLWKILSKEPPPEDFDPVCTLYRINIKSTKKRIALYKRTLVKLYNKLHILNKMNKTSAVVIVCKRTDKRISYLYTLINKSRTSIKMSEYGLNNINILSYLS